MSYIWGTSYASCLGEIDLHDPITPVAERHVAGVVWGRALMPAALFPGSQNNSKENL